MSRTFLRAPVGKKHSIMNCFRHCGLDAYSLWQCQGVLKWVEIKLSPSARYEEARLQSQTCNSFLPPLFFSNELLTHLYSDSNPPPLTLFQPMHSPSLLQALLNKTPQGISNKDQAPTLQSPTSASLMLFYFQSTLLLHPISYIYMVAIWPYLHLSMPLVMCLHQSSLKLHVWEMEGFLLGRTYQHTISFPLWSFLNFLHDLSWHTSSFPPQYQPQPWCEPCPSICLLLSHFKHHMVLLALHPGCIMLPLSLFHRYWNPTHVSISSFLDDFSFLCYTSLVHQRTACAECNWISFTYLYRARGNQAHHLSVQILTPQVLGSLQDPIYYSLFFLDSPWIQAYIPTDSFTPPSCIHIAQASFLFSLCSLNGQEYDSSWTCPSTASTTWKPSCFSLYFQRICPSYWPCYL